jgi:hypothetical protein
MENLLPAGRDARGRMTTLPVALRKNLWQPGQSGNPTGASGLHGEVIGLAREATPAAISRLREVAELDRLDENGNLLPLSAGADRRVVTVAATALIERGWGKAKDFDPVAERPPSTFNPRDYSPEELDLIEKALRLMTEHREEKRAQALPPRPRYPS